MKKGSVTAPALFTNKWSSNYSKELCLAVEKKPGSFTVPPPVSWKVMTEKEHSVTVKQAASDCTEARGAAKTIPDIELMNIFIEQKQFTEDWNNIMLLACSAFLYLVPKGPVLLVIWGFNLCLCLVLTDGGGV